MMDVLNHLFAAVCGQNPEHTWAPGGVLLPCCQRCTGLYVGAGVAALLYLCLRPKLTARFLETHAAFLLFMAPFGFHWVPHGPVLRTLTGVLFGFAVVTFLWTSIESKAPLSPSAGTKSPGNLRRKGTRERLRPLPPTTPEAAFQRGSSAGICVWSHGAGGQGSLHRTLGDTAKGTPWWKGKRIPLTPALSLGERENRSQRSVFSKAVWQLALFVVTQSRVQWGQGCPPHWQAGSPPPLGRRPDASGTRAYAIGLLMTLALLPFLAALGGPATAYVLSGIALGGASALSALLLANGGLALQGTFRLVCRRTRESFPP